MSTGIPDYEVPSTYNSAHPRDDPLEDDEEDNTPTINDVQSLKQGIIKTSKNTAQAPYTILLLGETSVGKSSIVEFIANVLTGRDIDHYDFEILDHANEQGGPDHQSRTNSARIYEFTSKNGTVVRIIDTPGLADPRGIEQDEPRQKIIATGTWEHIKSVTAVLILANGVVPRITVSTDYALSTLSASFPKTLVNNIAFMFTNVPSPLFWNFSQDTIPDVLRDAAQFLFDNPVALQKKYLSLKDNMNMKKVGASMRKSVQASEERALEVLVELFDWLDGLGPQPTTHTVHLYNMTKTIESAITDTLAQTDTGLENKSVDQDQLQKVKVSLDHMKRELEFLNNDKASGVEVPGAVTSPGEPEDSKSTVDLGSPPSWPLSFHQSIPVAQSSGLVPSTHQPVQGSLASPDPAHNHPQSVPTRPRRNDPQTSLPQSPTPNARPTPQPSMQSPLASVLEMPRELFSDLTKPHNPKDFAVTKFSKKLIEWVGLDVVRIRNNHQVAYHIVDQCREAYERINDIVDEIEQSTDDEIKLSKFLKYMDAVSALEEYCIKLLCTSEFETTNDFAITNTIGDCIRGATSWADHRQNLRNIASEFTTNEKLLAVFEPEMKTKLQSGLVDAANDDDTMVFRDLRARIEAHRMVNEVDDSVVKTLVRETKLAIGTLHEVITQEADVKKKMQRQMFSIQFLFILHGAMEIVVDTPEKVNDDWKAHLKSQEVWTAAKLLAEHLQKDDFQYETCYHWAVAYDHFLQVISVGTFSNYGSSELRPTLLSNMYRNSLSGIPLLKGPLPLKPDGQPDFTQRLIKDVHQPPKPPLDEEFWLPDTFPRRPNIVFLQRHFHSEGRLQEHQALWILEEGRRLMREEPNVLEVVAPVTIVGDIHGQFYDLLTLMEPAIGGSPSTTRYLFLGNYVDRGCFGIECLLFLLALKICHQGNYLLLRGNHESQHLTSYFTFRRECQKKYSETVYNVSVVAFQAMPLAAIVNDQFFCVHGGLSPELQTIEDLHKLDRICEPGSSGMMYDLLWSDPAKNWRAGGPPFQANPTRGCSYLYGYEAVKMFLGRNHLELMIRSHEAQQHGFMRHDIPGVAPHLMTIFSAPNYCDVHGNLGAILKYDGKAISIRQFHHVEHPFWLPSFQDVFTWSLPFVVEKAVEMLNALSGVESDAEFSEDGASPQSLLDIVPKDWVVGVVPTT